nr:EOG090X0EI4 [Lepidurus arcticus]
MLENNGSKFVSAQRTFLCEGSALALLRKKTGYSISNCKKALEVNNKDVAKAEAWLTEQAQAQGWAKATRLQSRAASQGLIGIAKNVDMNAAVLVEVNCETDFVARNEKFHSLVSQVTQTCLQQLIANRTDKEELKKVFVSSQDLSSYSTGNGTLADMVALNIGILGENLVLRKAVGIVVPNSHDVPNAARTHMKGFLSGRSFSCGKRSSITCFKFKAMLNKVNFRTLDPTNDVLLNCTYFQIRQDSGQISGQHVVYCLNFTTQRTTRKGVSNLPTGPTKRKSAESDSEARMTFQFFFLGTSRNIQRVIRGLQIHLRFLVFHEYNAETK